MQIARDIVPVGELKVHAASLLARVRDERIPIVITQHGRPAGVLLSPSEFDRLTEHAGFLAALRAGLADIAAGQVVEDQDLDAELEAIFALAEQR